MKIEQQEIKVQSKKACTEISLIQKLENNTQKNSKEQINARNKILTHIGEIRYKYFESLILAQDERWRRA